MASNGGYALKDDSHYIKPEMVSKIPDVIAGPKPGPVEVVDEVNLIIFILDPIFYELL